MKYIISIAILFISFVGFSQEINQQLKRELDSIYKIDQGVRELFGDPNTSEERKKELIKTLNLTKEEVKLTWLTANKKDSLNMLRIEDLIKKYGYVGKTLVGEPTNEVMWYVIQHSNKIEKYFPIIEKAGKDDELGMNLVAMMQDRMLMYQNKEQIYGTQASGRHIISKETGKEEMFWFMWPIKNPEKVNELRKNVGFKTTVEETAKSMDIEYKVYTLNEINKILEESAKRKKHD